MSVTASRVGGPSDALLRITPRQIFTADTVILPPKKLDTLGVSLWTAEDDGGATLVSDLRIGLVIARTTVSCRLNVLVAESAAMTGAQIAHTQFIPAGFAAARTFGVSAELIEASLPGASQFFMTLGVEFDAPGQIEFEADLASQPRR